MADLATVSVHEQRVRSATDHQGARANPVGRSRGVDHGGGGHRTEDPATGDRRGDRHGGRAERAQGHRRRSSTLPKITTNPNTLRAYTNVLDRVAERLDPDRALADVADTEIGDMPTALWGEAKPATWSERSPSDKG
jgi:hypothetical protein